MPWRSGRIGAMKSQHHPGGHYMYNTADGVWYRFRSDNWESMEAMVSLAAMAKHAGAWVYFYEYGSDIYELYVP